MTEIKDSAEGKTLTIRHRGFEIVPDEFRTDKTMEPTIPCRKTQASAGYDLSVLKGSVIQPHETVQFMTDICVYMEEDELFIINVRSSIGFNKKLRLVNTQGWIDSDFYHNIKNGGNIGIGLYNPTDEPVTINDGERVAQGIFVKYGVKDNDYQDVKVLRRGGIGSTGTK